MFDFMFKTVIMTQFLFIIMLDAYMAIRAICWVFRKLKHKK